MLHSFPVALVNDNRFYLPCNLYLLVLNTLCAGVVVFGKDSSLDLSKKRLNDYHLYFLDFMTLQVCFFTQH